MTWKCKKAIHQKCKNHIWWKNIHLYDVQYNENVSYFWKKKNKPKEITYNLNIFIYSYLFYGCIDKCTENMTDINKLLASFILTIQNLMNRRTMGSWWKWYSECVFLLYTVINLIFIIIISKNEKGKKVFHREKIKAYISQDCVSSIFKKCRSGRWREEMLGRYP